MPRSPVVNGVVISEAYIQEASVMFVYSLGSITHMSDIRAPSLRCSPAAFITNKTNED